jgi:glycosyltransferase involved in cell wall biosynthesis
LLIALRQSEIIVAPALVEYFGYAVMDGMLMRTPVVASTANIHLELVEDNCSGILFQNQDEIKYALAVMHASKEMRETLAIEAFNRITDERQIEVMANSFAEVLAL